MTGLKLKPNKCAFFHKQVNYLGHVIPHKGIATDPAKARQVANWPVPATPWEVQQFLGLADYYRRFILTLFCIASPLHKLTEQSAQFHWMRDIW